MGSGPAYIDLVAAAGTGGIPRLVADLEAFKKKYSVDVNYEEKIEANEDFYATIQQQLVSGLPTGWDMITITDWLAAKIISKGWAEKIDQTNVPNCVANLRDPLKNYPWDPKMDYHYPWQSGMTGIGYDKTTLTKNGKALPKSLADLWALPPDKVTFLNSAIRSASASSSPARRRRRRRRTTTSRLSTTSRRSRRQAPLRRQQYLTDSPRRRRGRR
jgi:spermidine/putrescine transport system substrate-binding protein